MAGAELEAPERPGLTPVQLLFLEHFGQHRLLTSAADAVGIPPGMVRRWLKEQPLFAEALDDTTEVYRDVVRRERHRRAIDGWDEPVYQRGELVGHVRKYSDALLSQMAKDWLPECREAPPSVNVQNTVQVVAWREKQLPGVQPMVIEAVSRGDDSNSNSPQLSAGAV